VTQTSRPTVLRTATQVTDTPTATITHGPSLTTVPPATIAPSLTVRRTPTPSTQEPTPQMTEYPNNDADNNDYDPSDYYDDAWLEYLDALNSLTEVSNLCSVC
jgi:hypothetical protein